MTAKLGAMMTMENAFTLLNRDAFVIGLTAIKSGQKQMHSQQVPILQSHKPHKLSKCGYAE